MESPLGKNLSRLVRIWRTLIDHRLKPLKLTQTHWITLYNIYQLPPNQSQIQLAKAIGIEQPSLVRTLDQLESKGLIMRNSCTHDRRTKRIKLTVQAKSTIDKINHLLKNIQTDIFYDISNDDIQHINKIISKLETNITNLYHKT